MGTNDFTTVPVEIDAKLEASYAGLLEAYGKLNGAAKELADVFLAQATKHINNHLADVENSVALPGEGLASTMLQLVGGTRSLN